MKNEIKMTIVTTKKKNEKEWRWEKDKQKEKHILKKKKKRRRGERNNSIHIRPLGNMASGLTICKDKMIERRGSTSGRPSGGKEHLNLIYMYSLIVKTFS